MLRNAPPGSRAGLGASLGLKADFTRHGDGARWSSLGARLLRCRLAVSWGGCGPRGEEALTPLFVRNAHSLSQPSDVLDRGPEGIKPFLARGGGSQGAMLIGGLLGVVRHHVTCV